MTNPPSLRPANSRSISSSLPHETNNDSDGVKSNACTGGLSNAINAWSPMRNRACMTEPSEPGPSGP